MKCDRRAVLTLTKEEQKAIRSLVDIVWGDDDLGSSEIWDIMQGIAYEDYSLAEDYGYHIVVTDK